jgi:hypothetical protein
VLVGADAARLGDLARELRAAHRVQAPVFVGDPADPAVAELVEELLG